MCFSTEVSSSEECSTPSPNISLTTCNATCDSNNSCSDGCICFMVNGKNGTCYNMTVADDYYDSLSDIDPSTAPNSTVLKSTVLNSTAPHSASP
ncbi:hypothetical protein V5799_031958 [Amblyomma americanum]|uniref:Uncharacterized protein n=1 Tax=Amblyomma americanum TaxID=6943 RepID=A0AAQ4DSJ3_AMBAM